MNKIGESIKDVKQPNKLEPPHLVGYKILRHDPSPAIAFRNLKGAKIYESLYWSDCGLYNGLAWGACDSAPIKIYEKENETLECLKKSNERWPDVEFKVVVAYIQNGNIICGEVSKIELEEMNK